MDNWQLYALINAKNGGGGGASTGTGSVRFLDYDGTIVKAYTPEQFANLTALPANPSHEGLTAQGWNYTLADAKTYVAANGALDIGQTYITDDGKTRIHIKLEEGRLRPCLGLGVNGSVVVDWGDDSATDTMTGTSLTTAVYQEHQYAVAGEYTISIAVTGEIAFVGDSSNGALILTKANGDATTNRAYQNCIKSICLGSDVTSIDTSVFRNCTSLASITIPNNVTSIGNSAFNNCRSLTSITLPDGVTSIGDSAFNGCLPLTSVTIPDSVTSIGTSAFSNCYGLGFIKFGSSTPPAVSNVSAWANIPTDCIIYVPTGSLTAYTSDSKYPSSSTYTYVEY